MTKPEDELRQVTALVLYGWGYPALFERPDGDRFQNRLVNFLPDAVPVIEGASQEALDSVLSHLNLIRKRYRDLLKAESTYSNPVWVWVDTPRHLSGSEILKCREQFEQWSEEAREDRYWDENWYAQSRYLSFFVKLIPDQFRTELATSFSFFSTQSWRQKAIVLAVFASLMLVILRGQ